MAKIVAHLTTLREERKALVAKRNSLEDAYRVFATEEFDIEEEVVDIKLDQARSSPQKNKRLQSIHEAHKAVLSKEAEIAEAERKLAQARHQAALRTRDTNTEGNEQNNAVQESRVCVCHKFPLVKCMSSA